MLKQAFMLLLAVSLAFSADVEFEVEEQSCPESTDILGVLFNLPVCVVERFFNMLIDGFVYGAELFLENSLDFITSSPDIGLFCGPYSAVMDILESLYTLAFMAAGAYYILKSHDVEGRSSAKLWLKSIFAMILALSFSFSIFGMILDINEYITTSLYAESFDNLLSVDASLSSLVFAFIMSFMFLNVAAVTFMSLLARYIMIPFLLLLFPIGIFLYFLPATREWGAFVFKFILLIVFMTSIDALLVLAMSYLFSAGDPNLAGGFVGGLVLMLGFGLIGIVNSIIYVIASISVITAAGRMFSSALSAAWKIALLASLL